MLCALSLCSIACSAAPATRNRHQRRRQQLLASDYQYLVMTAALWAWADVADLPIARSYLKLLGGSYMNGMLHGHAIVEQCT
jgi:hypothetical protein